MNKILILSILVVLVACSDAFNRKQQARFQRWRSRFGGQRSRFLNKADEKKAEELVISRAEECDKHNERFSKGLETYYCDLNALSDLETKDITGFSPPKVLLNSTKTKRDLKTVNTYGELAGEKQHIFSQYVKSATKSTKASINLATVWKKPVENQGTCGSCWTFGATAALECAIKVKKNTDVHFSKQELLDCAGPYGNHGCNGGSQGLAFQYIVQKGISQQSAYAPYTLKVNTCTKSSKSLTKIKNFFQVDPNDDAIKQALEEFGCLTVSINVGTDKGFMSYKGGIYNGAGKCDPNKSDHAVTLIGWGVENGVSYWLIRNSWGETWGEKGLLKLKMGGNACGIYNFTYGVEL